MPAQEQLILRLLLDAWQSRRSPKAWEKRCRALLASGGALEEELNGALQDILLQQLLCGAHPSPQIQSYLRYGLHSGLISVPAFVERVCNVERWRKALLDPRRPLHFNFVLQLLEEFLPKLPASARGPDQRITTERALRVAAVMLEACVALAEGVAEAKDGTPGDADRRCNSLLEKLLSDPSAASLIAVASRELPDAWERFQRARRRAAGDSKGPAQELPSVWPASAMWRLAGPEAGISGHAHSLAAVDWMLASLASGEACVAAWLGPEERLERVEAACSVRGWLAHGPQAALALWTAALRLAPRPGSDPEAPPWPRRSLLLSVVPAMRHAARRRGGGARAARGALRRELLPASLLEPEPRAPEEAGLEQARARLRSDDPAERAAGLAEALEAAAGSPAAPPRVAHQAAAARLVADACDPAWHGGDAGRAAAAAGALVAAQGALAAVALHGLLRPLAAGLARAAESAAEGPDLTAAFGALVGVLERTLPAAAAGDTNPPEAEAAAAAIEAAGRPALPGGHRASPSADGAAAAAKAEVIVLDGDTPTASPPAAEAPAADLAAPPPTPPPKHVRRPASPTELPLMGDAEGLLAGVGPRGRPLGRPRRPRPPARGRPRLPAPGPAARSSPAPLAGSKRKREEEAAEAAPLDEAFAPAVPLPDRIAAFLSRHGAFSLLEVLGAPCGAPARGPTRAPSRRRSPRCSRRRRSPATPPPAGPPPSSASAPPPGPASPPQRAPCRRPLSRAPRRRPQRPLLLGSPALAVAAAVALALSEGPAPALYAAAPALRLAAAAAAATPDRGPAEAAACTVLAAAFARSSLPPPPPPISPPLAAAALRAGLAALMQGPGTASPADAAAASAPSFSTPFAPVPFGVPTADAWGSGLAAPFAATPEALRAAMEAAGGARPLAAAALAAVVQGAGEAADGAALARAADLAGALLADLAGGAHGAARLVARSTALLAAELLEGRHAAPATSPDGAPPAPPRPRRRRLLPRLRRLRRALARRLGLAPPFGAGPVRGRLAGALADAGATAAALSLLDPASENERPLLAALACRVAEPPR
eukprot:tig00001030_g6466.t1